MKLTKSLPQDNYILAIAERVRKKYPDVKGRCEFMSKELTKELKNVGIRAEHVLGNFNLDEPGAFTYISPEDEDSSDEYSVNHDWVSVEGKILDVSATQFQQYVHTPIPDIVFIDYSHPLYTYYEELGHADE